MRIPAGFLQSSRKLGGAQLVLPRLPSNMVVDDASVDALEQKVDRMLAQVKKRKRLQDERKRQLQRAQQERKRKEEEEEKRKHQQAIQDQKKSLATTLRQLLSSRGALPPQQDSSAAPVPGAAVVLPEKKNTPTTRVGTLPVQGSVSQATKGSGKDLAARQQRPASVEQVASPAIAGVAVHLIAGEKSRALPAGAPVPAAVVPAPQALPAATKNEQAGSEEADKGLDDPKVRLDEMQAIMKAAIQKSHKKAAS